MTIDDFASVFFMRPDLITNMSLVAFGAIVVVRKVRVHARGTLPNATSAVLTFHRLTLRDKLVRCLAEDELPFWDVWLSHHLDKFLHCRTV